MRLVLRDEGGNDLGTIEVLDGRPIMSPGMEWVGLLFVADERGPVVPEDGDRWLEALAREFKYPHLQPFLET